MQFLTDINLNGNQLLNATIQNVAVDPSTNLVEGKIIYNTSEKKMKYYDGSKWSDIGSVDITIDDVVTEDSTNAVQSGAVKTYVDEQVSELAKCLTFKGTIDSNGVITSSDSSINGVNIKNLTGYKTGWVFISQTTYCIEFTDIDVFIDLESGDMIVFTNDYATSLKPDDFNVVQANIDTSTFALKTDLNNISKKIISINTSSDNLSITESTGGNNAKEYSFELTKKLSQAETAGPKTDITISPDDNTVVVPDIDVDEYGRIISIVDRTITIPVNTVQSKTFENPQLSTNSGVASWIIDHNLDIEYPNVTVYDVASKEVVMTDIIEIDSNNIKININYGSVGVPQGTYICRISG